jgi:hypothetical protein
MKGPKLVVADFFLLLSALVTADVWATIPNRKTVALNFHHYSTTRS